MPTALSPLTHAETNAAPQQKWFCYHPVRIHGWLASNWGSFTSYQKAVVEDIRGLYGRAGEPGLEVFHGGHVVIEDNGGFYDRWAGFVQRVGRSLGARRVLSILGGQLPSSHYGGVNHHQYEIRFPMTLTTNFGNVLFGKTAAGHTWFQTEAHAGTSGTEDPETIGDVLDMPSFGKGLPASTIRFGFDVVMHASDFINHKATGQQVGPFGYSAFSEKTVPSTARRVGRISAGVALIEYARDHPL